MFKHVDSGIHCVMLITCQHSFVVRHTCAAPLVHKVPSYIVHVLSIIALTSALPERMVACPLHLGLMKMNLLCSVDL
jgi:hypothetical protein